MKTISKEKIDTAVDAAVSDFTTELNKNYTIIKDETSEEINDTTTNPTEESSKEYIPEYTTESYNINGLNFTVYLQNTDEYKGWSVSIGDNSGSKEYRLGGSVETKPNPEEIKKVLEAFLADREKGLNLEEVLAPVIKEGIDKNLIKIVPEQQVTETEEPTENSNREVSEENKEVEKEDINTEEEKETDKETVDSDDDNSDIEIKDDEEDRDDEEDKTVASSWIVEDAKSLTSLYSKDIEELVSLGLLAKNMVIDLLSDKICEKSLTNQNEILKVKNEEIKNLSGEIRTLSGILSSKMSLTKKLSIVISKITNNMKDLKILCENNIIKNKKVEVCLAQYRNLIDSLDEKNIDNAIKSLDKQSSVIASYKENKNKESNTVVAKENRNIKVNTVVSKQVSHTLNSAPKSSGFLSNRDDGTDELKALEKLAGIK